MDNREQLLAEYQMLGKRISLLNRKQRTWSCNQSLFKRHNDLHIVLFKEQEEREQADRLEKQRIMREDMIARGIDPDEPTPKRTGRYGNRLAVLAMASMYGGLLSIPFTERESQYKNKKT